MLNGHLEQIPTLTLRHRTRGEHTSPVGGSDSVWSH